MSILKVMLDSGAYSAWRKGTVIDIEKYAQFIHEEGFRFQTVVNLDVIGNGEASYHNWIKLKDMGVDSLPVFHLGTDPKWLKKYMDKTDYVGLGAVANLSSTQRSLGLTRVWRDFLTDKSNVPIVKVHGMGITATDLLIKYPWYSVDSTTAVLAAGYGGLFLPKVRGGMFDPIRYDVYKISDQFNHEVGSEGAYSNLPITLRRMYEAEFERCGYKLGTISYIKKRMTKKEKKLNRVKDHDNLFGDEFEESTEKGGLSFSNSGAHRRRWNLMLWNRMGENMPSWKRPFIEDGDTMELSPRKEGEEGCILYTGGSFKVFKDVVTAEHSNLGFLFSYIVVNKNFLPRYDNIMYPDICTIEHAPRKKVTKSVNKLNRSR